MAKQGITVVLDQYEAMPHCFAMVIEKNNVSKKCFARWASFINAVVKGEEVRTKGTWIMAKTGREKELDVLGLSGDTEEEVLGRMKNIVEWSNKKGVPETLGKTRR